MINLRYVALDDIRSVLAELGIGVEDLTREYTGAFSAQRG
jgi:adenylate cyclase class 2